MKVYNFKSCLLSNTNKICNITPKYVSFSSSSSSSFFSCSYTLNISLLEHFEFEIKFKVLFWFYLKHKKILALGYVSQLFS